MSTPLDPARRILLTNAFWMPSVQTMVARKSSITNAFVNAVIPSIPPTVEEIDEALTLLNLDPAALLCAYCGNLASEWDHLRPLVVNQRPTGYVSEIANLVPACGKCNQSKGNKPWRAWMLSTTKNSPSGRNVLDVALRIDRLVAFERWREPTKIDFERLLGPEKWQVYWQHWREVVTKLEECQKVADQLKAEVAEKLRYSGSTK